jgi:hypothetical protein
MPMRTAAQMQGPETSNRDEVPSQTSGRQDQPGQKLPGGRPKGLKVVKCRALSAKIRHDKVALAFYICGAQGKLQEQDSPTVLHA